MDNSVHIISFGFDVLITVLLAATIYFAVKLSRHLDTFRSNRADMEGLIRELSTQITRAQEGISVLDDLSAQRGDELRANIAKAQTLSDELQLMTESGNSLAERLETMAVRNRRIVEDMERKALGFVYPGGKPPAEEFEDSTPANVPPLTATRPSSAARYEDTLPRAPSDKNTGKSQDSLFAIRDPDFGQEPDSAADFNEDDNDNDGYASRAERDLAEALKRRVPKKP